MQIKEKAVSWHEKYTIHLGMYLIALGALRTHFLYSLSQTANHTKCLPGM